MTRWLLAAVAALSLADRSGQADATFPGLPAAVTVRVPVGATLTIDGRRTEQMTAERHFVSPPLPAGRFVYTLRADFTWDGRAASRQAKVEVWSGARVVVDMLAAEAVAPAVRSAVPEPVWTKPKADEEPPVKPKADGKKMSFRRR